ncbi:MAG: hypothetical protein JO307_25970, partial [Bryobacterales bacterium]|nr:hypothetical protein [Bryobacterales bacterium]
LCQRDSQNGTWTGNTFQDTAVGFGEYAANINLTNNHIYLHPDGTGPDGVSFGGMNILFSGNDVHTIGNQNDYSGTGFIVADVYATGNYYAYTGNTQITNNTIQCVADGNICLRIVGHGTVVSGNTITATGSATGVYAADAFATITNNTIQIGTGIGLAVERRTPSRSTAMGRPNPPYAATVAGNTLSGTGSFGIYIASFPVLVYGNTVRGFASPIYAASLR